MTWESTIQRIFGWNYYEVKLLVPAIMIPTTTKQPLTKIKDLYVLSWLIRVRSMGTATYIGVGDEYHQPFRLLNVGDSIGFFGNPREIANVSKVYVISDTSDAEIELLSLFKEAEEAKEYAPSI